MGSLVTALIMILAIAFTFVLDTAKETFTLILQIGAGTGLIYLLRWYWWRINAWTEVSAMASSFVIAFVFFILNKTGHPVVDYVALLSTVSITTVVWLATTYLTPPVDEATLARFYEKVRPAGAGWKHVRAASGLPSSRDSLPNALLGWVLGLLVIYSALFGTGAYVYGQIAGGMIYTVVFAVATVWLIRLTSHAWKAE